MESRVTFFLIIYIYIYIRIYIHRERGRERERKREKEREIEGSERKSYVCRERNDHGHVGKFSLIDKI